MSTPEISRRTLAKGAAWAAPITVAAATVPAYAASSLCSNDAVVPAGKSYKLIGTENNRTQPFRGGETVFLNGDGKTTWSENPGYEVTFTYDIVRDLGTTILRTYISGNYHYGGKSQEGRVANVIDRSFNNGTGYSYTLTGKGSFKEAQWVGGQIDQIRDKATAKNSTLPNSAYVGYGINHRENEKIFAAYDAGQIAGELMLYFNNLKAGSRIKLTVYSRFAEPNNYDYMAEEFGLDSSWNRPILDAGMGSIIYFKESGERGDANGGHCLQLQTQNMTIFNGDLRTEKNTSKAGA